MNKVILAANSIIHHRHRCQLASEVIRNCIRIPE